jgi:phosphatidylglycerophosphatase A
MRGFIVALASWGGTGFAPLASGTVGTLGAIPFYLVLSRLPLWLYLLTVVAFTVFACWIADRAETIFDEKDSGKIVIDEVAGYLITMAWVAPTFSTVILGFILFRFFDVVKPQPARWLDRNLKNGYGVVLDDVAAGIYACAVLNLLVRLW